MKQEKIFIDFLGLATMYFRERSEAEFYANKLGINPDELCSIIKDMSDKDFQCWLGLLEKAE